MDYVSPEAVPHYNDKEFVLEGALWWARALVVAHYSLARLSLICNKTVLINGKVNNSISGKQRPGSSIS